MTSIPHTGAVPTEPQPTQRGEGIKEIWQWLLESLQTDSGRLVALLVLAMAFCFSPIIRHLPEFWFDGDSYFTHGVLVPPLCLYILYDRRKAIAATPVKPMWWVGVFLIPVLYACVIASRSDMLGPLAYGAVIAVFLTSLTIGGWRRTWALSPVLVFLIFALPFGQGYLDRITVNFQGLSTDMSYQLLKLCNIGPPIRINSTQIIVGDYSLYVAAACSGLKLTISVVAFVTLFMFIGRLKWWANLVLMASVLPLCILINGIRIAMIGAVGCWAGDNWATKFHDYSGYISILLCFFLLMKFTQALGWK